MSSQDYIDNGIASKSVVPSVQKIFAEVVPKEVKLPNGEIHLHFHGDVTIYNVSTTGHNGEVAIGDKAIEAKARNRYGYSY